jgi:hypothetical protein
LEHRQPKPVIEEEEEKETESEYDTLIDSMPLIVPVIEVTEAEKTLNPADEIPDENLPENVPEIKKTAADETLVPAEEVFLEDLPENVMENVIIPEYLASRVKNLNLQTEEESEEKQSQKLSSTTFSETSKDSDGSDSEESFDMAEEIDRLRPGYKMSNLELTKRIRKIYLEKMKQIADTSSRLLVTAARVS